MIEKIESSSENRKKRLAEIRKHFNNKKKRDVVFKKAKKVFKDINKVSEEECIKLEKDYNQRNKRLEKFLSEKAKRFKNSAWKKRYSSSWIEVRLPNFRIDSMALEAFEDSLYEYLAYLGTLKEKKRIYSYLNNTYNLNLEGGESEEEIQKLFYDAIN